MLDLNKGKYPIIIKPNFGQPTLINLNDFKQDDGSYSKNITFDALIIVLPSQTIQEILENFHSNLYIQPIIKDNGEFSERRGEKFSLKIVEIEKVKKLDLNDQPVLEADNCIIWDIYNTLLHIRKIYGKRRLLYKIKFEIEIPIIKSIQSILNSSGRNFILFDIVHDIPNLLENKINYHSIAIYDKEWTNFKFIHASDFHIARRNDFILNFLKEEVRAKTIRYTNNEKKLQQLDNSVLYRDFEFREEFQEDKYEKLRRCKYNFNSHLRKLIKYVNDRVLTNDLDFMLMTGDLIDFLKIAKGNHQYKNNFHVLMDILLGKNKGLDEPPFLGKDNEFINKREIMVPVFTIVGNHDYRKASYGLRFAKIYKIFGMNKADVKGYHDTNTFNYLFSLYSRDKFLKDYLRYFNPNLNYRVKIGKEYNLIFLDTGQDSIADIHDLLKGGPSTKGIKDYQIDLLRNYIKLSYNDKIIIVMHTPPISPELSRHKRRKLKKLMNIKNRDLMWRDLYEDNLIKHKGSGRLEKILNLKYQTIMYNWSTILKIFTGSDKIIRRKVDLILCGHTHTLKEYRLKEAQETERINYGFWFFPFYIEVPCEVYTSKYRKTLSSFNNTLDLKVWYEVNKPFVLQTQAVGPISAMFKFKPPGFRYYTVRSNQLTEAKVFSLYLKESVNQ